MFFLSAIVNIVKMVTVDRFLIRNGVNVNYEVEGGSSEVICMLVCVKRTN